MSVWKGNHYTAGLEYGNHFVFNAIENMVLSDEKREFTKNCISLYQKY